MTLFIARTDRRDDKATIHQLGNFRNYFIYTLFYSIFYLKKSIAKKEIEA